MASVIVTSEPSRYVQLVLYTTILCGLTYLMAMTPSGLPTFTPSDIPLRVDLTSKAVQRSLAAIAWAPFAWNVFPRLEYRHRVISTPLFGSRTIALYAFAAYIVCFSSFREHVFFEAIASTPKWTSGDDFIDDIVRAIGTGLLAFGVILSVTGFYHLRITYTYMGEYFGFMMDKLVTSFPFNFAPDPMYNGSVLMHYGYAFRALSPAGLFLSMVTALSYWIAAKIFEEPFMMYCYNLAAKQAKNKKNDADNTSRTVKSPQTDDTSSIVESMKTD